MHMYTNMETIHPHSAAHMYTTGELNTYAWFCSNMRYSPH